MSFCMPKGAVRPPRIAPGEGVYLIDEAGRRYLDTTAGAVVSILGTRMHALLQLTIEQTQRVTFAYPRFFESEHNIRVADRLTGMAGAGCERAFFVSGGEEPNLSVIKLARQYAFVTTGNALGLCRAIQDITARQWAPWRLPVMRFTNRCLAPSYYCAVRDLLTPSPC